MFVSDQDDVASIMRMMKAEVPRNLSIKVLKAIVGLTALKALAQYMYTAVVLDIPLVAITMSLVFLKRFGHSTCGASQACMQL